MTGGRRDGHRAACQMKAAVLHAVGAPLAAGVCHSDHHYMSGDLRCPLPVVVGHEGAGVVEAVGRAETLGRAIVVP